MLFQHFGTFAASGSVSAVLGSVCLPMLQRRKRENVNKILMHKRMKRKQGGSKQTNKKDLSMSLACLVVCVRHKRTSCLHWEHLIWTNWKKPFVYLYLYAFCCTSLPFFYTSWSMLMTYPISNLNLAPDVHQHVQADIWLVLYFQSNYMQ